MSAPSRRSRRSTATGGAPHAASVTAVLTAAAEEAASLLRADGAMIYLYDPEAKVLRFARDAGIRNRTARRLIHGLALPVGTGMFGTAFARAELVTTTDYPSDPSFTHSPIADQIVETAGMRAMAVAPMVADGESLGALGVFVDRVMSFEPAQLGLLRALASHAAVTIANERLQDDLRARADELARRVDAQRTLGDIAARITALRDPAEVLQEVVDAAHRLLKSDGAHLTVPDASGAFLRPRVIAGGTNARMRRWLASQAFPVGGGMNGLAASLGKAVWTADYMVDRRIPHEPDDQHTAERMGLRGMAVAPLRAPGGEVLGTLAVSYREPCSIDADQLDLLQRLADQGAIALSNATLVEQIHESERRYRFLAEHAPDVVYETDADGIFIFMSDAIEPMTGWTPAEMVGQHFAAVIAPESLPQARIEWDGIVADPTSERRVDLRLSRKGGGTVPTEVRAAAKVVDGEFRGIHGITRDISERIRLEEELRQKADELERSEERYRFLVERSPDIVYELDADADFTFISEGAASVTGWLPEEVVGRSLMGVVSPATVEHVREEWEAIRQDPSEERRLDFELLTRDGGIVPVEARGVAILRDGRFAGVHGSVRDISDRMRLENDLRRQKDELARRVDAQQTLAEIARQLTAMRDPAVILQRTLDEAARLLRADGGEMDLVAEHGRGLRLAHTFARTLDAPPSASPDTDEPDQGIAGLALMEGRVVITGDYLSDESFKHSPEADAWVRDQGIHSVLAAPLIGEHGWLGAMLMDARRPDAWDADDAELLGALAAQAAVAVTNARLYDQLEHRVAAQTALSGIAAQITAIRDSAGVLQRAVDEAVRLLGAETGAIQVLEPDSDVLADNLPVTGAAMDPADRQVSVRIGQGIAGQAVAEGRVAWTGDYLNDDAFPHTDEADEWIRERSFQSQMTAPLIGGSGPIGSLTVYSPRRDAFGEEDAELLETLANQAAAAVSNARLLAQVESSERRYRHLVENSPDTIWSARADGTLTYFSETIERLSGWKAEELIGKHFRLLVHPDSGNRVNEEWQRMVDNTEPDLVIRFHLRHRDGHAVPAETTGIAEIADGKVVGAHGAVRDISVRERLELDLREQAAEIAASSERANLARELHDSVTQALFSMGLTMRSLELLLDQDPAAARGKLGELRDLQKDALAEMRTLIFELRPKSLEQDGLEQALRTHAAAVQGRTGLSVTVEADTGLPERLPAEAEEALYRIGQEALHNVVKHANASSARILLARIGGEVRLSVTDDGIGFDPANTPRGHLGLVGMRQRAERIGAEFAVTTRPGYGTAVSVSWRLPAESEGSAGSAQAEPLARAGRSAE
jgi:PAS domain S-box-containing protein